MRYSMICVLMALLGAAPAWAGGTITWPMAIAQAFKNLPAAQDRGWNNAALEKLKTQDFSLPEKQALLRPLIDAFESSPRAFGVREPGALARLAETGGDAEQEKRLVQAVKLAVEDSQDLANHNAEVLMGYFKRGIPVSRLDKVHDSVEALLTSAWPYLSRENSDALVHMHEALAEARYQARLGKVAGLVKHMGDALAEQGLPSGTRAPDSVDLASLQGYSDDPRRPFPFPPQGYYSQQLPMSLDQLRAVNAYQEAIDYFLDELDNFQKKNEAAGGNLTYHVNFLEGDLAAGKWENISLASLRVSYQKAVEMARYAPAPKDMPVPIDLRLDFTPIPTGTLGKFIAQLREEVYNKYGVLIRINQASSMENRIPIEGFHGGGLLRHIAIARTIKALGKKTVREDGFERERQSLRLNDGDLAHMRDAWVLSVSPGIGDFGKVLERERGARVVAMDWWYALTPTEISRYIKTADFRSDRMLPIQIGKIIQNLPSRVLPGLFPRPFLPSDSFREIFIHDWFYNLLDSNKEWAWDILREAIRVAAPGGNIRVRFPYTSSGEMTSKKKALESFFLSEFAHLFWDVQSTGDTDHVLIIHKPRAASLP